MTIKDVIWIAGAVALSGVATLYANKPTSETVVQEQARQACRVVPDLSGCELHKLKNQSPSLESSIELVQSLDSGTLFVLGRGWLKTD